MALPLPPGPPPDEFLAVLDRIAEALDQIDRDIRTKSTQPVMPPLVAGQWPRRDGDKFPRGA